MRLRLADGLVGRIQTLPTYLLTYLPAAIVRLRLADGLVGRIQTHLHRDARGAMAVRRDVDESYVLALWEAQ